MLSMGNHPVPTERQRLLALFKSLTPPRATIWHFAWQALYLSMGQHADFALLYRRRCQSVGRPRPLSAISHARGHTHHSLFSVCNFLRASYAQEQLVIYNDPMRILISNDDGYLSEGIATLASHLSQIAHITVVAPERNRSGASNSLTLDRPLSVKQAHNGFFYINGTPTDCVHIALTGLIQQMPDLVISGINDGANMGDDTIYSGTVAAAMEGYLLSIPSIAISMSQHNATHFETAAKVAVELVEHYARNSLQGPALLNVNVPDVPYNHLKGRVVTRLGKRHKAEPVIEQHTPRGEKIYWIGAAGQPNDGGEGTDFFAIANNQVSITPIHADLTKHEQQAVIKHWLTY